MQAPSLAGLRGVGDQPSQGLGLGPRRCRQAAVHAGESIVLGDDRSSGAVHGNHATATIHQDHAHRQPVERAGNRIARHL